MKKIFITGIGTEVGKTVISSVVVEAFEADYWKPVQAGDLDNSDTMKVRNWVSNSKSQFHREQFRLTHPMSPHAAAIRDGVQITLDDFKLPQSQNDVLVLEGAGGTLVPVNESGNYIIDLASKFEADVLLVVRNYLGSINHTLMSIEVIKQRGLNLVGLIVTGPTNSDSESIIESNSKVPILLRVEEEQEWNANSVLKYKTELKDLWS